MVEQLPVEAQEKIAQARKDAIAKAMLEFEKIDKDGNGQIDREEVESMFKNCITAEEGKEELLTTKINDLFKTFDANNDGVISQQEWIDFFGSVFDSVLQLGLASGK